MERGPKSPFLAFLIVFNLTCCFFATVSKGAFLCTSINGRKQGVSIVLVFFSSGKKCFSAPSSSSSSLFIQAAAKQSMIPPPSSLQPKPICEIYGKALHARKKKKTGFPRSPFMQSCKPGRAKIRQTVHLFSWARSIDLRVHLSLSPLSPISQTALL